MKVDAEKALVRGEMKSGSERDNTFVLQVAGEAHFMLGLIERHNGMFGDMMSDVIDGAQPQDEEQYQECIHQVLCIKNQGLLKAGTTPEMAVFGRHRKLPGDLCGDHDPVTGTLPLFDTGAEFASKCRAAARKALANWQDKEAYRWALLKRPRPLREFHVADRVAVWRKGKGKGMKKGGGNARWFGVGLVIGHGKGGHWIELGGQLIKASPEQMRMASAEEIRTEDCLEMELLDARARLRRKGHGSTGYENLLGEERPPSEEMDKHHPMEEVEQAIGPSSLFPGPLEEIQAARDVVTGDIIVGVGAGQEEAQQTADEEAAEEERRQKEIVEVIERELGKTFVDGGFGSSSSGSQEENKGVKRPLPAEEETGPHYRVWKKGQGDGYVKSRVSEIESGQSSVYLCEEAAREILECLAAYYAKKNNNEISYKRLVGEDKAKHDEATGKEWSTVRESGAVETQDAKKSQELEEIWSQRRTGEDVGFEIVDSRIVHTDKKEAGGVRAKARWCIAGYQEEKLESLVQERETDAPTPSLGSKNIVLQVTASRKWVLQMGDVKGAFLQTDDLQRVLYVRQPKDEPLPGMKRGELVRLLRSVYGLNTAPLAWFRKAVRVIRERGFIQSRFDPCLWWMPNEGPSKPHDGVLLFHVDDVLSSGEGKRYNQAIKELRERLPFRKWDLRRGRFTGTDIAQDEKYNIHVDQEYSAKDMKAVKVSKGAHDSSAATDQQMSASRGLLGNGVWHVSNTRVDLGANVALGQQKVKAGMTVGDVKSINQISRRAKQFAEIGITFWSIPVDQWLMVEHSDSSLNNCGEAKTQAGYVISMMDKKVLNGEASNVSFLAWKSFKLPIACTATLHAESQGMLRGIGKLEWLLHRYGEMFGGSTGTHQLQSTIIDGECTVDLQSWMHKEKKIASAVLTDCKSLYDHLMSRGCAPSGLADPRTGLLMAVLRESLERCGGKLKWTPSALQIADCLTKITECDFVRSLMMGGMFQAVDEAEALRMRAEAKRLRLERGAMRAAENKKNSSESESKSEDKSEIDSHEGDDGDVKN